MYQVDRRDRVVRIDAPRSSVGAPLPLIAADEDLLLLAYFLEIADPDWDGTSVRSVSPESREPAAIISFRPYYASLFGPPNDEAFAGHPLAGRGLMPYGSFLVERSSWVRVLERMNAVHPQHDAKSFLGHWKHFIFAFHDSTFECVAADYDVVEVLDAASHGDLFTRMQKLLSAGWS
jgi:hypothetical protein